MKVLLYEWNAYMQSDLEEVLKRMGFICETFSCQMDGEDVCVEDPYVIRNFRKILHEGHFDVAMSFNYWTSIAVACDKEHIPYIAWGYDSPLSVKIEKTLSYPMNYLFVFDKDQLTYYRELGFKNVYHLPLAVNTERLDKLRLSEEENKNFAADISFVGNMYGSDYNSLRCVLTDYERGYFESLIETQYRIYGDYFIDELISDEMLDVMQKRIKKEVKYWSDTAGKAPKLEFRRWVTMLIAREVTRRERLLIVSTLSKRHPFKFYSPNEEKLLSHVEYLGTVSSHSGAPKVFRASKINLNMTYKQITVGMPLRVLDIMGAGGFLMSNYQEELVENFRPGVDCVIYESVEDAIEKADYYLAHEDERLEIAHNGHEAVKRFSYENQLDKIFQTVLGDQYRQSSSLR